MKKLILLAAWLLNVELASAQNLYFPPNAGNTWDTLSPASLNWCPDKIDSLYGFLEDNNTKAFMLLKDGKIVLERYFGGHTPTTPHMWASAGKTITAFMVGIAQQEGYLSIHDTTSAYLGPGWTNCSAAEEQQITLRHQLTMTSGLDDGVPDHYCTLDTCLNCLTDPGTRWAYHNGPYTLLDSVMEIATGIGLNSYTTQKLKNPTGMTGAFVRVGYNNVFFSNARSMARFGLLMLNRGNWNGNLLMTDTAYFDQMVNTSQNLNESYGYLWWLNGKSSYMIPQSQFVFNGFMNPNAPADLFVAMGSQGQFLNVVPSQNLVMLRMGDAPDNLPVPFLMNDQIWAYVNDLTCAPVGTTAPLAAPAGFQLFPNPARDAVQISAPGPIAHIELYDAHGRWLRNVSAIGMSRTILSLEGLPTGLYWAKVVTENGQVWTQNVVRE
jgi:CubicO group peptidase (beta-lactamase class C family)